MIYVDITLQRGIGIVELDDRNGRKWDCDYVLEVLVAEDVCEATGGGLSTRHDNRSTDAYRVL